MDPQAEELNQIIQDSNPVIFSLLSEKGRRIFFPKLGILSQSASAKTATYNATIGIAVEDDGNPMRLSAINSLISLPPKEVFPYAPSYGLPELRLKWREMIRTKNPSLSCDFSLPVVTSGLTHALNIIGYLFVNPNDQIIIPDKFWENYDLVFEHWHGGRLETFPLFEEGGFNLDGLKEKLFTGPPGKKIVLLNFPNNPTGYTPTIHETAEISNIIKEAANLGNEIAIILDDSYFGLVYKEGVTTESLFSTLANLHPNVLAIKADGITKEEYAWGLRIAFITYGFTGMDENTSRALEDKTAGAIRGCISNASNLSQNLVLHGFTATNYAAEKKEKYEILKSRFEEVENVLKDGKYGEYFRALPFNSGYFMCVELKENLNAEKIRQDLLAKSSTGVIALDNLLRVAFSSLKKENIKTLFDNIYQACRENK